MKPSEDALACEACCGQVANHILAEGFYMRNDDQVRWYILDRLKAVGFTEALEYR